MRSAFDDDKLEGGKHASQLLKVLQRGIGTSHNAEHRNRYRGDLLRGDNCFFHPTPNRCQGCGIQSRKSAVGFSSDVILSGTVPRR